MCVCSQKLRLRILVTRITDPIHPVFQYMFYIRPVRVMARTAIPLRKGHVHILRLLISGFRVARKAESSVFYIEQRLILGCVRLVAGEATLVPDNRRVVDRNLLSLLLMAIKAELVALLSQQLGTLRGMRGMTGEAHPTLKWLVLNSSPGLKAFRIMTVGTELPPFFRGGEWLVRVCRFVA